MNLYQALRNAFPQDLAGIAIECCDSPGGAFTWSDIDRASARIANLFEKLDLPPASCVAVQVEKSVEALLLYLAVLRSGHVFLPLNSAYQASEIEGFVADAEPAVFVTTARNFGWVARIAFRAGVGHVFTLNDDRTGSLLDRAAPESDRHPIAVRQADDLAAILYTSGTTGRSKGAMLSHGNLLSNAHVLHDYWGWRRDDVLLHVLPIFHVHGLFVASHGALLAGAKMLWCNRFDASQAAALIPKATVFMGVPTLYTRLLGEASMDAERCRGMRLFIAGSAPLLPETFERFRERTGHTILERYGMSETVMLTSNPYRLQDGERSAGTVGFPLPGIALRVRDASGKVCGVGEVGGIEVRGPNVFSGYWRMPEKTREEFTDDGWFKTGDVGLIDERGYVHIVGRSKDLIITGGYNVYPAEVESVLNSLPGVAESAVVGVPHPDFGEGVIAVVVARDGSTVDAQALVATMKSRIAHFKVPKRVFVVAELPRNAMGKVQKNVLRAEHKTLFTR